jgi:hypothetical protein
MVRTLCLTLVVGLGLVASCWAAGKGELEIRALDAETGKPIAVRMHLKDARGKPVRPPKVPYWNDHFVLAGSMILELPAGTYTFEMERGLEYKTRTGHFILKGTASDNTTVEMNRFIDMTKKGWWSGDLYIDRPESDIELLMLADDLHVAPLIAWGTPPNAKRTLPVDKRKPTKKDATKSASDSSQAPICFDTNRFYGRLAGRDDRAGGLLLFFNLSEIPEPLRIASAEPANAAAEPSDDAPEAVEALASEFPSAVDFLKATRDQTGKHVDVGRPFNWDLPVLVASGMVDSINVANDHHWRSEMQSPMLGKPREGIAGTSKMDSGYWSQAVYFHLLNCGLRLPPSAGSASGVAPNPIGYNRVYVHCDDELTWDKWWENLRQGRVVVTNGPLLQPRVNGELPGHVFQTDEGGVVQLDIALNLSTREKIEYLEVIKDGQVIHEVRLDQWAKEGGRLPSVTFEQSGWLLVRARTNNADTYRFAMTGPYYVEIGSSPRISKASAQLFLNWVHERVKQIKLDDPEQRASVLKYHRAARDFWQKKVDEANAE